MGRCILNLKMWIKVLIGFGIVSKARGFSGGKFPQSCGSLLPQHETGSGLVPPEASDPPFTVTFESSWLPGDPVTVVLSSKGSTLFRGFMLDAQIGSNARSSPVGRFVILDSGRTQLLDCYDLTATAVSQTNNLEKDQVKVNWTGEGEERDVIFRATFLETFSRFWTPITVPLPKFTTTIKPSSPEPTTKTDVTQTIGSTEGSRNESSNEHAKVPFLLMFLDSIVEEIKMEVFNIQTFLFDHKPFNFGLIKMSLLVSGLLVFGADVSSLLLFRGFSSEVAPVALVSVMLVIASAELLAAFMPIGPSHELCCPLPRSPQQHGFLWPLLDPQRHDHLHSLDLTDSDLELRARDSQTSDSGGKAIRCFQAEWSEESRSGSSDLDRHISDLRGGNGGVRHRLDRRVVRGKSICLRNARFTRL